MIYRLASLLAACAAIGASYAPAVARDDVPPQVEANPLCQFHGEGCSALPAEWTWQRHEPRTGTYSVEIPCDEVQADAFGQIMALSRAGFPAGNTRACIKATSGFTATLVGVAVLPEDATRPTSMLKGQADLFSALVEETAASGAQVTTFKGRRALINTIDKADRRSRIVIVEVGQYGVILLSADILAGFPGTREDGDGLADRFIQSLEIAT